MRNNLPKNGPTPFDKFLAFTKRVVSVPKSEIDKREREYQAARKRKRRQAKGTA
jgi:hypothetical protein